MSAVKIDGEKVHAIAQSGLAGDTGVDAFAGWADTGVHEMSEALAGRGEISERAATALASALGAGLSEILPDSPERTMAWVGEQLAACRATLDRIAATLPVPGCPSCRSTVRSERGTVSDGGVCANPWHWDVCSACNAVNHGNLECVACREIMWLRDGLDVLRPGDRLYPGARPATTYGGTIPDGG